MNRKSLLILLLFIANDVCGQSRLIDSLRIIINRHTGDSMEVSAFAIVANKMVDYDSAIKYAGQGLLLAKKINDKKGEADCLWVLARHTANRGNIGKALEYGLSALDIYQVIGDKPGVAGACVILQGMYRDDVRDYRNSLKYAFMGAKVAHDYNVKGRLIFPGHRLEPLFLAEIGQTYLTNDQPDSSLLYVQKSIEFKELFYGAEFNFPVYLLGNIQTIQGNYKAALSSYRSAIPLAIQNKFYRDTLQIFAGMSTLFIKKGDLDSSIYYAKMVESSKNPERENSYLIVSIENLVQAYKLKGNSDSVLKYVELKHALIDSIFSRNKDREVQNITFNERLKQQEIRNAQAAYKSKVQLYSMVTGLLAMLMVAAVLWDNSRKKQKAYKILQKQKQETDVQKAKVELTLEELKLTQSQLIQSEKMASLGELTAGIAHEIQNPLNFVNNFSEVNAELIDEMEHEIEKGNLTDVKALGKNIKENQEKISHHGKRADAIVKSMLQHSRSSSHVKEPTDINALADEYLRLAYHGLRAKDKSFNAITKTEFDASIGNINVIPQDIGRVILNLITNAFYAVSEKKKLQGETRLPDGQGYEPTVVVSTRKMENKVEIRVKDNGNGIPKKVLDKIFQPFFTTKPTGQGTGLGLSMSYDIVTKAHGGQLRVETKEGEFAEFIITLPIV